MALSAWPTKPEPLDERLARLGIPGCTCPHEWKSLGRLYGQSMGNGWVRLFDVKTCPEHGEGTAHPRNLQR